MIYLGSDHNGLKAKEKLKKYFTNKNIAFKDLGNDKLELTDDYPDFAEKVVKKVLTDKQNQGILICGSGQGMAMAANRYKKIRAALGYSVPAADRSRQDENSNVLCLPAWDLNPEQIIKIVNTWLNTAFSQLPRHQRRIKKLG